jgi:hypothetical protein
MVRISLLISGFAALLASALLAGGESVSAQSAPASKPRAVVELFTSQGCSSCVKADAYFAKLAARSDVVAISLHVDYWDYLGWQDTLGSPEHTARQRDYAEVHGTRRIYTPQIVVNGVVGLVGSKVEAVETAIADSSLPVPVSLRHEDGRLEIEVGARPLPGNRPTTIRFVLLTSEATVPIARGENSGSTIDYYNVVRAMWPIGMWDGNLVKITLPEDELMADGVDACAVLVQEDLHGGPGAILGAAWLGNW